MTILFSLLHVNSKIDWQKETPQFKINMLRKFEIKEKKKKFKKTSKHQSHKFSQSMINYFKILIKMAQCSERSKVTLSKHLKTIFMDCINDEEFQVWLVETFGFCNRIDLTTLLSDTLPEYQVSRAGQEKLTK